MKFIILICNKAFLFLLLLLFGVQFGYGQERENKVNTIIDSLGSVKSERRLLIYLRIEPFIIMTTKKADSIKLVEIEKQLTDEEIRRRVILAYNEAFTDDDINKLYDFVTSSAYRKLPSLSKNILNQFKDIIADLRMISENLGRDSEDLDMISNNTKKIDNPVQFSYGQERENKINTMIDSSIIVKTEKSFFFRGFNIESLKTDVRLSREDSIKLVEIENQLTDEEIRKRVIQAYNEVFTDEEINLLYDVATSPAYHKLLSLNKSMSNQFKDIYAELRIILDNIEKRREKIKKKSKFIPIPVEREDGYYATINYDPSKKDKDIILEKNPAITKDDILEVKKIPGGYYDMCEIEITLKRNGAKKLYSLTENNIGKPIAVVFDKHIISIAIVNFAIPNGRDVLAGNFSEEEIEKIIKKWSNK